MNENTPPIDTIGTRETLDGIGNRMPHLDGHAVETATETAVVSESEASSIVAAAEQTGNPVSDAAKTDASRRALEEKLSSARARGVEWVRASDLLSRGTGRMAGVGIRFPQVAGVQTRRGVAAGVGVVSRRVRELPPVSAFGRRSATSVGTVRSGVGMR